MSLNAARFQTRSSRLAALANGDLPKGSNLHSRTLGLNVSLQELGLSNSAINDITYVRQFTILVVDKIQDNKKIDL